MIHTCCRDQTIDFPIEKKARQAQYAAVREETGDFAMKRTLKHEAFSFFIFCLLNVSDRHQSATEIPQILNTLPLAN